MGEPLTRSLFLADAEATARLGRQLVAALPAVPRGWLILLSGELGSGKSTLARAMLRALGYAGTVPSPTYTLVEPYDFSEFSVYHIDLYRINDVEELPYLGWSDLEDGLRVVEWPERVPGLTGKADLLISLRYERTGRMADLQGLSERGARLVSGIHLK